MTLDSSLSTAVHKTACLVSTIILSVLQISISQLMLWGKKLAKSAISLTVSNASMTSALCVQMGTGSTPTSVKHVQVKFTDVSVALRLEKFVTCVIVRTLYQLQSAMSVNALKVMFMILPLRNVYHA